MKSRGPTPEINTKSETESGAQRSMFEEALRILTPVTGCEPLLWRGVGWGWVGGGPSTGDLYFILSGYFYVLKCSILNIYYFCNKKSSYFQNESACHGLHFKKCFLIYSSI